MESNEREIRAAALALAREFQPAAITLDIRLPDISDEDRRSKLVGADVVVDEAVPSSARAGIQPNSA